MLMVEVVVLDFAQGQFILVGWRICVRDRCACHHFHPLPSWNGESPSFPQVSRVICHCVIVGLFVLCVDWI